MSPHAIYKMTYGIFFKNYLMYAKFDHHIKYVFKILEIWTTPWSYRPPRKIALKTQNIPTAYMHVHSKSPSVIPFLRENGDFDDSTY